MNQGKRITCLILVCLCLLCGCTWPLPAPPPAPAAFTVTPPASPPPPTATARPSPTLTPGLPPPTPTATPVPFQVLRPVAQLANKEVFASKLSPDGRYLAVSAAGGVTLYRSDTFEQVWFQPTDQEFNMLAFRPDGRRLALANNIHNFQESPVEIWETSRGRKVSTLPPTQGCLSITWSPDGSELLSFSYKGEIVRWQASTGKMLARMDPSKSGCGEGYLCSNATWSSDGKRIIASVASSLRIWDASSEMERFVLTQNMLGKTPGVIAAAPTPGDARVAVAASNFQAGTMVIDSQQGQVLHFIDPQMMVTKIAWSPDGKILALSSSAYKTIELWDTTSYTRINSFEIFASSGLDWSPDGQVLYVSGYYHVSAIRASDGEVINAPPGYVGEIARMHWDEQGFHAEVRGQGLITWDANSLEISDILRQTVDTGRPAAVLSPGGSLQALWSGTALLMWDSVQGRFLYSLPMQRLRMVTSADNPNMAWSPDGSKLAVSGVPYSYQEGSLQFESPQVIQIWEARTATQLQEWKEPGLVAALAWSPDGRRLAASSGEHGKIEVRDVQTGASLFYLPPHKSSSSAPGHYTRVLGLAWSPDGTMLASGDLDGLILLWQIPPAP